MLNNKYSKHYFSLLIFVISLIVYLLTLAPDVTFTDCGELAAVCTTLGIAHPTGYPFFTILGHLWTYIPLPFTPIFNLNIFVAVITALSVVVFFHISLVILLIIQKYESQLKIKSKNSSKKNSERISETKEKVELDYDTSSILIAVASALIYAFAQTVWQQAVSLEVYSLHILMVNLILLTTFKAINSEVNSKNWLLLTALLLGLSFSNHLTTILIVIPLIFIYFFPPLDFKTNNKVKLLFLLTIPFLIGLSVYLYLPLRAATGPEFNWGGVSRSLDKFLYHVQGKQYQVWMFSDPSSISTNFSIFIKLLPYQLGFIGLLPFIFGFYYCFKKSWKLATFLSLLVICCLIYSLNYSIHDIDTYFLTAYIAIILFSSIGLYGILKQTQPKIKSKILIPIIFLIPLISLVANYKINDLSDDHIVPEYTRILTQNLQPNAIILSSQWDFWCSCFWYKQKVEHYRTDITLIEKELLRRTWYLNQLLKWYPQTISQCKFAMDEFLIDLEKFESGKKYSNLIQNRFINMLNCFIDANYGNRPIYLTLDVIQQEPDVAPNYQKIPEGFAFRLEKEGTPFAVSVENMDITKLIFSINSNNGHLVDGIRDLVSLNFSLIGNYAVAINQVETAKQAYKKSLIVNPKNSESMRALELLK